MSKEVAKPKGTIVSFGDKPAHVDPLWVPVWKMEEAVNIYTRVLGFKLTPEEGVVLTNLIKRGKTLKDLPVEAKIKATDPWLEEVKKWEKVFSERVGTYLWEQVESLMNQYRQVMAEMTRRRSPTAADVLDVLEADAMYERLLNPEGVDIGVIKSFTEEMERKIERMKTGYTVS